MIDLIVSYVVDIDLFVSEVFILFMVVFDNGCFQVVKYFLKLGVDFLLKDGNGWKFVYYVV